ncbi:hypothetical protein HYH03_002269 [Edaphochlamys debaryana]|uniref:phytol kinase n=1 Tax=Edaphochlamys debaryana TaxID=47281 RepID=A0A835YE66_9CHLO|nr:hypothetical protein HYH03_002269 [Edaphochlamys debaryana]|eukprot:KAG2499987.1 hypothetical protein HYH03_002269 [Edaphochlamys debaryana]
MGRAGVREEPLLAVHKGGWGAAGPAAATSRLQWLEGCAAAGVPAWVLRNLRALTAPIAAACRPNSWTFDAVVVAVDISQLTARSARLCLKTYIEALVDMLHEYDTTAPQIRTAAAPLVAANFLSAVSRATSSAADLARHLQLPATQAQFAAFGAEYGPEVLSRISADALSSFDATAGQCLNLCSGLLQKEASRAGAGPLPPVASRLAAALRDSQLLAASARSIMTYPGPHYILLPGQGGNRAGGSRAGAVQPGLRFWPHVYESTRALALLNEAAAELHSGGGAAAPCAASALGTALAHPHVAALRLGLLQTLWEQAGMEPGPGERCDVEGYDIAVDNPDMLVHHHHNTVLATLGLWQEGRQGLLAAPDEACLPPEPGVPPGLQLAMAAARTAEALCRLSRGQGLAGVYTAEQRRLLSRGEVYLEDTLPFTLPRHPRSSEELPHWAEASAWVIAAALEGLEVAAANVECPGGEEATTGTREGLISRLRRAGLGASLDHALRLAFSSADRAAAPGALERDRQLALALGPGRPWVGTLLAVPASHGLAAAYDVSGVALTLAKRASLLGRRLEAVAASGRPGAASALPGGPMLESAGWLAAALGHCAALLRPHIGGLPKWGRGAAAEPAPAPHMPADGSAPGGELEAYFFQAASRLAVQLGADVAACQSTAAAGPDSPPLPALTWMGAGAVLADCFDHVSALCSAPGSQAPARLLACQPHRLIAAACKLLVAWRPAGGDPKEVEQRGRMQRALAITAMRLAAHPSLSARVRRWLVTSGPSEFEAAGVEDEAGAAAAADEEEADEEEAEHGCLEQLWIEGWRSSNGWGVAGGSFFSLPFALLRLAQGDGPGGRWAADAAFRSSALELLGWAVRAEGGGSEPLPQLLQWLLRSRGGESSSEAARAATAALCAPLPPLLSVPPEGRALLKLRVCGFPGCASFGGRSEAGLELRKCGGCRAVRYCGPDCQRAHWGQGHRVECRAMAEAEGRMRASGVVE